MASTSAAPNGVHHGNGSAASTLPARQRYTKLKKVGEGTYASVFLAKNIETGERVAIKKIKIAGGGSASGKDGLDPTALREVGFLREMKCENVIAVSCAQGSNETRAQLTVYEKLSSWTFSPQVPRIHR